MLCLFVSYNSIHLPGPLCTKCISSFISKYSFFFLFSLSLSCLFTMPIRARFLSGLMVCDEGRFECLSVCFFSFLILRISLFPYQTCFPTLSSLFSHVLQVLYSASSHAPLQRFGILITARLVRTITTLCLFLYIQKNLSEICCSLPHTG